MRYSDRDSNRHVSKAHCPQTRKTSHLWQYQRKNCMTAHHVSRYHDSSFWYRRYRDVICIWSKSIIMITCYTRHGNPKHPRVTCNRISDGSQMSQPMESSMTINLFLTSSAARCRTSIFVSISISTTLTTRVRVCRRSDVMDVI